MIMVYHAKREHFVEAQNLAYLAEEEPVAAKFVSMLDVQGCYEYVASVESDDLDTAYRLTNHIDCAWWEQDGVARSHKVEKARSTSIGDLMVAPEGIYAVMPFGFKKVKSFGG